jgi:hypothetical protein
MTAVVARVNRSAGVTVGANGTDIRGVYTRSRGWIATVVRTRIAVVAILQFVLATEERIA